MCIYYYKKINIRTDTHSQDSHYKFKKFNEIIVEIMNIHINYKSYQGIDAGLGNLQRVPTRL